MLVERPPDEASQAEIARLKGESEVQVTRLQSENNALREQLQRSRDDLEASKEREIALQATYETELEHWKLDKEVLRKAHEAEVTKIRDECVKKLSGLEEQHSFTLEGKMVRLRGSLEGQAAQREKQEKEARIELLRKQSSRRLLHKDVASAWGAWTDYHDAKVYALTRMKQVANRLRKPELADAFEALVENREAQRAAKEMAEMLAREAAAQGANAALEEELQRVRAECDAKLAAAAADHKVAMERQLIELTGSAEELAALRDEKDKEGRVELLRRQVTRRIMNADISRGFTAWYELWSAKTHAMRRLKEVGNKLRTPGLYSAFSYWTHTWYETKAKQERERLERESKSLEAQVRRARFEASQLELQKIANDDEIRALKAQVSDLLEQVTDGDTGQLAMPALKKQVDELREAHHAAQQEAMTQTRLRQEAEEDGNKQREENQKLLAKLLREQRRTFEGEIATLKKQTEAQQALTAEEEKEARVQLLRRQICKRIVHSSIARGWTAWAEMYEARVLALQRLQQAANRLRKPELAASFSLWMRVWYAKKQALIRREAENRELDLKNHGMKYEDLKAELERAKQQLVEVSAEREATRARLAELDGGRAEAERLHQKELQMAKEERVELLHRQMTRRMLNQQLTRGWTAWLEQHEARSFALRRMQQVASHLRTPELAEAFGIWSDVRIAIRRATQLAEERQRAKGLRSNALSLEEQLKQVKDDAARRIEAAEERQKALEHQVKMLSGQCTIAESMAAQRGEEEKSARVELLTRQFARRMKNAGLAHGWLAWLDMWSSRTYAVAKLRQVANRLRTPELADAFRRWVVRLVEQARAVALADMLRKEAGLEGEHESMKAELKRVTEEYEAKLSAAELAHEKALKRQLIELTGSAEELAALRDEKDKEGRVELLRRQVTRRIMNADISRGFTAWYELWSARTHALGRLRDCGNKLRAPDIYTAFAFWMETTHEAKLQDERERLERESKSLEAQVRRARFDSGQLELLSIAQKDEILALKERLRLLTDEAVDSDTGLRTIPDLRMENARLKEDHRLASEAAEEAEAKRVQAEEDIAKARLDHQKLLQRLLEQQRKQLEAELDDVKRQVGARTDEWSKNASRRAELERELIRSKEENGRVAAELSEMTSEHQRVSGELNEQIDTLKSQVITLKDTIARIEEEKRKLAVRIPSPTLERKKEQPTPEKKKKGTSPLGNIDLDEGPGAQPIAVQLGNALRKNAGRVLDLFRDWDDNGDGEVSRAEFHRAMPLLGLDVPKKAIDELFSQWDSGGDGTLSFRELQRILKSKPSAPTVENVTTAMSAITRLKQTGKKK